MKRVILAAAWALCIIGILPGCASMGRLSPLLPLEKSLVFQPRRYPDGDWSPANLDYEDVWFDSADGVRLHGWFADHPHPRAVVLFCHGNAGNITSRARVLRELHDRHGMAAMIFDYRGYGRSEGRPNEQGVLEDARAARAWLAERTGVPESEIVLIGHSLGGGVAVQLAASDGCRGLVLASTFTSLPDVAQAHAPWLPAHYLMTHRLHSLETIKRYHGPLLQSHGDADEVIPYQQGLNLFAAAPGPKRFVTISGGDHNRFWNEECHRALDDFIAALNGASPSSPGASQPAATPAENPLLRLLAP